jgi:hypothetical protein
MVAFRCSVVARRAGGRQMPAMPAGAATRSAIVTPRDGALGERYAEYSPKYKNVNRRFRQADRLR